MTAQRLLHYEIDHMKDNENARDVMLEHNNVYQLHCRGRQPNKYAFKPTPKRGKKTKKLPHGERRIGVYRGAASNARNKCYIILAVHEPLEKHVDQYPAGSEFSSTEINKKKLWREVTKLSPTVGTESWTTGWLRYRNGDGVTACNWNVQKGGQSSRLLEHHEELNGGDNEIADAPQVC